MLSRIAESLFWIGRYTERADDTARILDSATQQIVEDPAVHEREACQLLLNVMGLPSVEPLDLTALHRTLAYSSHSTASVAASLAAARESARRAREVLPSEMWAAINATWRALPTDPTNSPRATHFCAWARERTALINGIAESTMIRDEGWQFLVLGRSLERVDMTARLLTSTALSGGPQSGWQSTLRACGAHEAFLRTYRGQSADLACAEFLLLDRLFPRSVMGALRTAEACLQELEASAARAAVAGDAARLLGRARANLEYRSLTDVVAQLPQEMAALQDTCKATADAISLRYFDTSPAMSWVGG